MRAIVCGHRHWSLGCIGLLLAGCAGDVNGIDTASIKPTATAITNDFVPGVPKGYQCPLVPNGFDPVGSIYRLDKDGTYFRVKDFTTVPAITALRRLQT